MARFHHYRQIFIETGVRTDISLPRQHSLMHYVRSIRLFGSPNGLCSSITESKHIKAVKEPWRRSNRYNALSQMLRTLSRLDKMAALRSAFTQHGMMEGSTSSYAEMIFRGGVPLAIDERDEDGDHEPEIGPVSGPKDLSYVELAKTAGVYFVLSLLSHSLNHYLQSETIRNSSMNLHFILISRNSPRPSDDSSLTKSIAIRSSHQLPCLSIDVPISMAPSLSSTPQLLDFTPQVIYVGPGECTKSVSERIRAGTGSTSGTTRSLFRPKRKAEEWKECW